MIFGTKRTRNVMKMSKQSKKICLVDVSEMLSQPEKHLVRSICFNSRYYFDIVLFVKHAALMMEKPSVLSHFQVGLLCEMWRVNRSPVRFSLWWWCCVINEFQAEGVSAPSGRERSSDRCWISQSPSVQKIPSCSSSSFLLMFYSCALSSESTDGLSLGALSIFYKFLDRPSIWSVWKMQFIWFLWHSQPAKMI